MLDARLTPPDQICDLCGELVAVTETDGIPWCGECPSKTRAELIANALAAGLIEPGYDDFTSKEDRSDATD